MRFSYGEVKKYFISTESRNTIDCHGEEVLLNENTPILVAHPLEMPQKEIAAWQEYFINNHLKQPFEQVWEPVYIEENIKEDRYEGCSIPVYKFSGKEAHGITSWGLTAYSEDFGFRLVDCELSAESETWRFVPGTTNNETYQLGKFKVNKMSRYANHIIYLLDRWTIEERIAKNDATIEAVLGAFTVAQLLQFISLASEKNSTNSLAVLMEYKNQVYGDYDPLMEFTLE